MNKKGKLVHGSGVKTFGFLVIAAGGAYSGITKDFRVGSLIIAVGALIIAVGEFL